MEYLLHLLIIIGIYSIVAMSLDILVGFTGLISVAHAAFYGIGAYATALLGLRFGLPFYISMPVGIIASSVMAFIIARASLQTQGDYFVIATFSFQVIIFSIMNNWISLTGGPVGLYGIPQLDIFGIAVSSHLLFLILVAGFVLSVYFILHRLVDSAYGRVLMAIREDEIFAMSMGRDVVKFKISAFLISAAIASIGGSLYAYYMSYIDPTSFTIMESIFILSIVIIGGASNLKGSIVGAVLLIILPEALRFIGMPNSIAANMKQIIYGGMLVLFMMIRPQGLLGSFSFSKGNLIESKTIGKNA